MPLILLLLLAALPVQAGIRDHTRPGHSGAGEVAIDPLQARIITLSEASVARYPMQRWLRGAARLDGEGRVLEVRLCGPLAAELRPGLRVIAFVPQRKSLPDQGRVMALSPPEEGCRRVKIRLAAPSPQAGRIHVVEVVIPQGRRLAVPREAIVETPEGPRVYLRAMGDHFHPRAVHTGLEGERYVEILHGLEAGEQVVTVGSFFIHAQHQLKNGGGGGHVHHAH